MTEWLNKVHFGDCLETLRRMPEGIVQTCVTSPPYFGLRSYLPAGHPDKAREIGQEDTPDEFVQKLVAVFREVRRVLRDDGTCWVNMGDSYAANRTYQVASTLMNGDATNKAQAAGGKGAKVPAGMKPKDLIGVPWLLAFALRADGWYLRQEIVWSKPNPMPESVRDRCTKSHEHIFLLAKAQRYYFDAEAIAEPFSDASLERLRQDVASQRGSDRVPGKTNGPMKAVGNINANRSSYKPGSASNVNDGEHIGKSDAGLPVRESGRNKRSVWHVPTTPYSGAHFATFPEALIEPCILAGSPAGAVVLDPFMGSGTTASVATRLGRKWIGCDLNQEYEALQRERLIGQTLGLELA